MSGGGVLQLTRYLAVGASGYLLAMALYALLLAAGVHAYLAIPPTFVANGVYNFALNRAWSFGPSGLPLRTEFGRFCAVAAGSLVVNYSTMYLLLERANVSPVAAQAVAVAAATPVGFLGNKLWSFGRPSVGQG